MAKTPNEIWRDYATDGVPASGLWNPPKADIREWATQIDIYSSVSGYTLIFQTRADLYASLDYEANRMAWVVEDTSVAYNGIYQKLGASGTGSWTRVADLPFSFIVASNSSGGTPSAIQATTDIPVSSSALILLTIAEDYTGTAATVSFNGQPPLAIKTNSGEDVRALSAGSVVYGVISGSTFRLASDEAIASLIYAARDEAVAAVARAPFDSVTAMLASTEGYDAGSVLRAKNFLYEVVSTGEHLTTAGGVKLKVLPVDGYVWAEAWADTVTNATLNTAVAAAVAMRLDEGQTHPYPATLTIACKSTVEIQNRVRVAQSGGSPVYGLNIDFENAYLYAASGGNLSTTIPVFDVRVSEAFVKMPLVDGKRLASCTWFVGCYRAHIVGPRSVNCSKGGFAAKVSGNCSNTHFWNPDVFEMRSDTTEAQADYANFDGYGFVADTSDFYVHGGRFGWSKYPIYLTSSAAAVTFINPHVHNDGTIGNPRVDTVNIYSEASDECFFYNGYYDNGYIIDNGGYLHVTGWQLVLSSRVTLTDPIIKVKCTAARAGQSPAESKYSVYGASIDFLPDDTETYNWVGNYSTVSGQYNQMRLAGSTTDAYRHKVEINTDTSGNPARLLYRAGGAYIEKFISGTNSTFQYKYYNRDGSSIIGVKYDPFYGEMILDNGDGVDGLPCSFVFGTDKTYYIKASTSNLELASGTQRVYAVNGIRVGTATDIVATTGTDNGVTMAAGGGTVISTSGYAPLRLRRQSSDGAILGLHRGTTEVGSVSVTASGAAYNTSSDRTLKDDDGELTFEQARAVLDLIEIHNFRWKSTGESDIGVFAQDLYLVYPRAVTPGGWHRIEEIDDGNGTIREIEVSCSEHDDGAQYRVWQVDYSKLVSVIARCVQGVMAGQDEILQRLAMVEGAVSV